MIRKWLFAAVLTATAGVGWAQHEGHGGMSMPSMPADRDAEAREAEKSLQNKLIRLQEKISDIEEELERSDISPKKRERLQKKLDKLYAKKNRLLGVTETRVEESVVVSTQTIHAVYACPMGDYSGPKTADGRCPRCRMELRVTKEAK